MDDETGGCSSGGTKRERSAQEYPPAKRHESVLHAGTKRVRESDDFLDR